MLPARAYLRIASVSSLADQLLVELVEPERLVAVSADTAGPTAFRLGARPRLSGPDDLERLLALHPDLLVASSFGNPDLRLERVRAAGIAVLDLGESRGLRTLADTIRRLAGALDAAPRGERLVDALVARVCALTPPGDAPRPRALYLAAIADRLFGGTVGTAYHDILATAGLDDAAAGRFRDWPQYAVEDVLALDPDLIVTATGGADALRRLPGIADLRACATPGGIVEVDPGLLDDPGLLIPDAAAALRRAVEAVER
ncbi:MAG: ABC transporter substrate-binding protein [Planctomycetes bacterium]|nr:ABC transporter substrate-binding protein [Planctomycetota bacterium]